MMLLSRLDPEPMALLFLPRIWWRSRNLPSRRYCFGFMQVINAFDDLIDAKRIVREIKLLSKYRGYPRILQTREHNRNHRPAQTPIKTRLQRYLHSDITNVNRSPSSNILKTRPISRSHQIFRIPNSQRVIPYAFCQCYPSRFEAFQLVA